LIGTGAVVHCTIASEVTGGGVSKGARYDWAQAAPAQASCSAIKAELISLSNICNLPKYLKQKYNKYNPSSTSLRGYLNKTASLSGENNGTNQLKR
jgi:hypothetical protein